jgi:uncharacterized protein
MIYVTCSMNLSKELVDQIKQTIHKTEPGADIILFGSYARGDNRKDSDIDLLILSDKKAIDDADKKRIIYELYEVELNSGHPISSVILSKKDWKTKHTITPFYQNIKMDGVFL